MQTNVFSALARCASAIIRWRFDGAMAALVASAIGVATAPMTQALQGQAGTLAWLVDLASHWQWLYVMFASIAGALLLARGAWLAPGAAGVLIAIVWACTSAPLPAGTVGTRPGLTIVSANLQIGRADLDRLRQWAGTRHADIVVLQELTANAADQLQRWSEYPYRVLRPEEGPFGLAILSRHPLHAPQIVEHIDQPQRVRTELDWYGHRVAISAVHPMPPLNPAQHARRAALVEAEASWALNTTTPALVVGDLNASPWSSSMHGPGVGTLRRASAMTPTWPAALPVLPIDQVLATTHWRRLNATTGPSFGSDHRPVVATLMLAPA